MYAITGITGQVGGAVARALLNSKQSVRAVARDGSKAAKWADLGCEVALADIEDTDALTTAFTGAEGVFVMLPPCFDPTPGFHEVLDILDALRPALLAANPAKVVCLSTIGAQASNPNLLTQLGIMEETLGDLPMPVAFLRPAWFMENSAWDVPAAREDGVIPSFLLPLDKPVPMVAVEDVGRVAAQLLQETWSGRRIVELEGPRRVSPNEIAAAFTKILGHPVRMDAVPRKRWTDRFKSQGMKNPTPRIQMLNGFNEGWIEFESGEEGSLKGTTPIETVLQSLVKKMA